jgi:predicted ester cyclase
VAQAFYDRFAAGDLSGAMELFADDCVTAMPGGTVDKAGHEAAGRAFRDAFPDGHQVPVRVVESDDQVSIWGRFKGTHTGDLVGPNGTIPASGNQSTWHTPTIFRWSTARSSPRRSFSTRWSCSDRSARSQPAEQRS